ncbi:MAG: hypothetical protein R2749_29635 [Acidimicrobiales bacterium]
MTAVGQRPTALTLEHRPGDTGWAVTCTYSGATPIAPTVELTDAFGVPVEGANLVASLVGQVVTITIEGLVPIGRHRWRLHDSGLTHLAGEFVSTDQPRPASGSSSVAVEVTTGASVVVQVAAAFSDSDASYEHSQASPSATWTINHNLGFRPNVGTFSAGGVEVDSVITHISVNQTRADFNTPRAGFARCS